jgi:hypothetical protein
MQQNRRQSLVDWSMQITVSSVWRSRSPTPTKRASLIGNSPATAQPVDETLMLRDHRAHSFEHAGR